MNFVLDDLIRNNIKALKPYSSARHEFKGEASIFLDANENSFGSPLKTNYNRYPDPLQWELKSAITKIKGVPEENIFIGNGSDEVIDLALRIFCEPKKDNIIICPPTYGMYEVSANINDVEIRKINLLSSFHLDVDNILKAIDANTKIIFICSPNNPTGNNMNRTDIEMIINNFNGLVIIDEAYINFSRHRSFISELTTYPNLLVMQTLSKAWGLASLRLGLAFASMAIIELFNKVKPPYNINLASQQLAIEALKNTSQVNEWITKTVDQRNMLVGKLKEFPFVTNIHNSDANFLLVKVLNADKLYVYLSAKGIIVRNRSKEILCENCLRFTIGNTEENELLLEALKKFNV